MHCLSSQIQCSNRRRCSCRFAVQAPIEMPGFLLTQEETNRQHLQHVRRPKYIHISLPGCTARHYMYCSIKQFDHHMLYCCTGVLSPVRHVRQCAQQYKHSHWFGLSQCSHKTHASEQLCIIAATPHIVSPHHQEIMSHGRIKPYDRPLQAEKLLLLTASVPETSQWRGGSRTGHSLPLRCTPAMNT